MMKIGAGYPNHSTDVFADSWLGEHRLQHCASLGDSLKELFSFSYLMLFVLFVVGMFCDSWSFGRFSRLLRSRSRHSEALRSSPQ